MPNHRYRPSAADPLLILAMDHREYGTASDEETITQIAERYLSFARQYRAASAR
jgi:hypothetical protein